MRAILERDFLYEASRDRAFRSRTYLGLVVALAVSAVLFLQRDILLTQADLVATWVFRSGAAAVVVMLALLAPGAVVGSVLAERVEETLPLVLASPVGPFGFALAKFLSRSAVVLTWGLAALLPLGITVLLGGVGAEEVLRFIGLAVAVVVELAGWSLWVSCVSRRPATASVLAYLLPALRWGACLLPGSLLLGGTGSRVGALLVASTPVPAFMDMVEPSMGRNLLFRMMNASPAYGFRGRMPAPPPPFLGLDPLFVALAAAAILAFLCIVHSARRLRFEAEPRGSAGPGPARPAARRRVRVPPASGNPVAWKEGSLLNTGASRPMYYGTLLALAVVEGFYVLQAKPSLGNPSRFNLQWLPYIQYRDATTLLGFFALQVTGLSFVAAVNGASSIAFERTQGTWDLLRATPLTVAEVVAGKIRGLGRGVGLLALVPAAHLWFCLAIGTLSSPVSALAGMFVLGVLLLFWTVLGMLCGALARNPGKAVTVASLLYCAFLFGIPFLSLPLQGGWTERYIGEVPGTAVLAAAPWSMATDGPLWFALPPDSNYMIGRYTYGAFREPHVFRESMWALSWALVMAGSTVVFFRVLVRRLEAEGGEGARSP